MTTANHNDQECAPLPAATADAAAPAEQRPAAESWLQIAMRFFSYWMMIQLGLSILFPAATGNGHPPSDKAALSSSASGTPDIDNYHDSSAVSAPGAGGRQQRAPFKLPEKLIPHWRPYTEGKLEIFLLEDNDDRDALRDHKIRASAIPLQTFDKIEHHADAGEQSVNVTLNLEDCARRNCTLYLHVILSNPRLYDATACLPFVRFSTHRKSKLKHLFGGDEDSNVKPEAEQEIVAEQQQQQRQEPDGGSSSDSVVTTTPRTGGEVALKSSSAEKEYEIVARIPSSVTVNVVADWSRWDGGSVPAPIIPYLQTLTNKNNVRRKPREAGSPAADALAEAAALYEQPETVTLGPAQYPPMLFINEFWLLDEEPYRVPFNTTMAKAVNLTVSTKPLTLFYFLMFTSFTHQMENQKAWGLQSSGGMDEVKRMLLETQPWLLALTMVVSLLHMFFEYLTFSSDISFWRDRKNFRGISLQTVVLGCYMQTAIFLYLCDGNETSYSILVPSGIGVLIEYWKLRKAVRIEDKDVTAPKWAFWRRWGFRAAYDSKTALFDQEAMRYLFMAMVPCFLGYSAYSAVYDKHRGWYNFVLRINVKFIYMFGFVKMMPQIFINYKKKSVPRSMPWRVFAYKFLNTIIDDIFSFVVKMPLLHRLACFRDDVVFVILLYQRWIYPADESRNEDDPGDNDSDETTKKEIAEKAAAADDTVEAEEKKELAEKPAAAAEAEDATERAKKGEDLD